MRIAIATLMFILVAGLFTACKSKDKTSQTTRPQAVEQVHETDTYQSAYDSHYQKAQNQITADNADDHADKVEAILEEEVWVRE